MVSWVFCSVYFKGYSKTDAILWLIYFQATDIIIMFYILCTLRFLGKTVKVAHWRLTDFLYFLTHLGNNAVIGKKSLLSILQARDHNSEQIAVNAMIWEICNSNKSTSWFF